MDNPWMSIREVADYLGVAEGTVHQWRSRGVGPPGVRVAGGLVRYRKDSVDGWMDAQSDPQPAA